MELKQDSDIMAIIKMSDAFGKYRNLAWAYVELFEIRPMGKHLAKIRAIFDSLKTIFQAEAFTFDRRRYGISQAGIAEALNIVILKNLPNRPENHNYLKKVMVSISEREASAKSRQDERDFRKKEATWMAEDREEKSPPLPYIKGGKTEEQGSGQVILSPEENAQKARELSATIFKTFGG